MSSIYSAEVRKVVEREGVTDLRAYYIVKARHEAMRAQEAKRATIRMAYQPLTPLPTFQPGFMSRLWNKIENYMKGRFDY